MIWDDYLKFVRGLPCAICADDSGSDPHHEVGNKMRGIAFKSHNIRAFPLCRKHHSELHNYGHSGFEEKYGVTQASMIVDVVEQAVYQGVLTIDREMV
jgi:hypothetical protein